MGDDCKGFYLEAGKFEGNRKACVSLHACLPLRSSGGDHQLSPWCGKGEKQRRKHEHSWKGQGQGARETEAHVRSGKPKNPLWKQQTPTRKREWQREEEALNCWEWGKKPKPNSPKMPSISVDRSLLQKKYLTHLASRTEDLPEIKEHLKQTGGVSGVWWWSPSRA